ncbi:DUF618-domain-containing protein [Hyphopichia burtonii NRRL Y-1933]|uniref:DUF618-domain-containing protein n=2 Tax=Dikarya TaxID=451864 RepID=A0A1E4RGJ5_9ASCO|nr:DUF618-domain-containing protein [Hyphopichia burtonii NRRL Y-1933]ODV66380.1 DUF618-domain-containing protein [Hyphopichia burtonii NRRL Y-1933]
MSFSADIYNKKLASLQETQDSIVTISQWVLFHHRHCKESAELWSKFILKPQHNSAKRLSLLYLCNDVVQQARHKRKYEFIQEFSKVLPEVFNKVFRSLDANIQPKVERLIGVWEQRKVFSGADIINFRKSIELSKQNKVVTDNASDDQSASRPTASNDSVVPDLKHLNNTYLHLNQLVDVSQANLNQVGVQSKTYLPNNPGLSDNLPSPKIYISKLNTLEKLCNMSKQNIDEIKRDRKEIIKILDGLKNVLSDALTTDDSKISIIDNKLEKLYTTRTELKEILDEDEKDTVPDTKKDEDDEEPSPEFEMEDLELPGNFGNNANDEDDDMIPTYEDDEEEDDDDKRTVKRQKTSSNSTPNQTPTPGSTSGNSTPSSKKSVAFSENIQIKEFDREEQTDIIKVIKSDDDSDDNDKNNEEGDLESNISDEFGKHHKDDLELKHEKEQDVPVNGSGEVDDDDDEYDPLGGLGDDDNSNDDDGDQKNSAVLDILSKLK